MTSGDVRFARPSILERLRHAGQTEARSNYDLRASVESLRDEVRRNIEALLNTRRPDLEVFRGYPNVATSHLAFGIPDLTGHGRASRSVLDRLPAEIAAALRIFEPRLDPTTVKVEKVKIDTDAGPVAQARFTVTGTLRVHPFAAPVAFDTRIDIEKGDVRVQEVGP